MTTEGLFTLYTDMRDFLGFDDSDVANLTALQPIVAEHGPGVTDRFYAALSDYPATAKIIEGRVDGLKRTHIEWMKDLVAGEYDQAFFNRQFRIGEVHVAVGIEPAFVESVMSVMRTGFREAIDQAVDDKDRAREMHGSLVKVLDLSLMVINLSYQDERLARISGVTGMSRKLIENLVSRGSRK